MQFPRIASFRDRTRFQSRLDELQLQLPVAENFDGGPNSAVAQPLTTRAGKIGNRFCILPMEGWDGTTDGRPTELTTRRWERFGLSGAKLIWGGEAVAVRHDGRANPRQLVINDHNAAELEGLRRKLVDAHAGQFGSTDDLCVGLQLTHSGRYAVPTRELGRQPRPIYRHPVLDQRCGVTSNDCVMTDDELRKLADDFIAGARRAQQLGFSWVDIKHCHGYLGHELLSGFDRPGLFGGSFENRTRFLRTIVEGIRAEAPGLEVGVRVSVFDFVPFKPGPDGPGIPEVEGHYRYAFGGDLSGAGIDLSEPEEFLRLLIQLQIELVCTTCGSPYYNPHIQRPALFPPSDGYQPPEDPLVGVARQIRITAELKQKFPELTFVGSGYTYLQEWLPSVAEAVVRGGMVDSVGLGRMVLSYPELPADVLAGRKMPRKKICRTFSDCTTAPRNGLVSGCFPLDQFYKDHTDRVALQAAKQQDNESPVEP
ncbi:MAG: NADH:flavin oxidoreductase [Planctomycetaceae bacterium]|jgi:2,4-dienoyl-CoA reductase-like NADH-dependent reductase (Old Yellow Enzyme family)